MKPRIVEGAGIDCPRCGKPTQIREHKQVTDKQLRQPFYYSRWFCCLNRKCRTTLVMMDEHKVWNENDAAKKLLEAEEPRVPAAIAEQLTPPGGTFNSPWED
jgi:hypothetical protein